MPDGKAKGEFEESSSEQLTPMLRPANDVVKQTSASSSRIFSAQPHTGLAVPGRPPRSPWFTLVEVGLAFMKDSQILFLSESLQ